jgi:hypothetical protein
VCVCVHQDSIGFEMVQKTVPKSLLAQNSRIAENNKTILGASQRNVQSPTNSKQFEHDS